MRCIVWNTRNVTCKTVYKSGDDCCLYDICAPPNQSDIRVMGGMSGSKAEPCATDVHLRSTDGDGTFNWRWCVDLELPAPQQLSTFKLQLWNVNIMPDDCLAEAAIPLWAFFELARRNAQKLLDQDPDIEKKDPSQLITRIPRQWISLRHPYNSDHGDVEISIEVMPKSITTLAQFIAAPGPNCYDEKQNSPENVLTPPVRPESFPWWRLDKQIWFRIKYCFKKFWWLWILIVLIGLFIVVGIPILQLYVLKK